MKKVDLYGKEVVVYDKKDLSEKADIISEAKAMWDAKTKEYVEKNGDMGSCVVGAGIVIHYLGPRCRKPVIENIILSPACAQGSLSWESSVKEVLLFLKNNGIEATYEHGWMD